jgi:hypothetical protein
MTNLPIAPSPCSPFLSECLPGRSRPRRGLSISGMWYKTAMRKHWMGRTDIVASTRSYAGRSRKRRSCRALTFVVLSPSSQSARCKIVSSNTPLIPKKGLTCNEPVNLAKYMGGIKVDYILTFDNYRPVRSSVHDVLRTCCYRTCRDATSA